MVTLAHRSVEQSGEGWGEDGHGDALGLSLITRPS